MAARAASSPGRTRWLLGLTGQRYINAPRQPSNGGGTRCTIRPFTSSNGELHVCRAPLRLPPAAQVPRFYAGCDSRPRARDRRERGVVQRGELDLPASAAVSRARPAGPVELDGPGDESDAGWLLLFPLHGG